MDKSKDLKDLDLSLANRGVWLVKVPKYMSECWKNANPGDEVGKVTITEGNGPADVIFKLDEKLATETNRKSKEENRLAAEAKHEEPAVLPLVPTNHKFVVSTLSEQSLAILSTDPVPDIGATTQHSTISEYKVAIEGKVIQRAECRPVNDDNYMALKRLRMEIGNKPRKEVVQLKRPVQNYKPKAIHESQLEYAQRKKDEGKKTRLDKEVVMNGLFKAFESHQYYNVKDLVRITNQPITFLKEILKEICVYNTKAPHKNMWELKEEYRHYKQEAGKD